MALTQGVVIALDPYLAILLVSRLAASIFQCKIKTSHRESALLFQILTARK